MQYNMKIYEQQILPFGEDELMSLQAVSRANRSALRGSGKVRRTTATSGRKCYGLFGLFDPVGSWARMFSELLIGRKEWYSSKCVLIWKRRDMRYNRTLYQLAASTLPTNDTEYGLLPTVQTQGMKQCENSKTIFMPLSLLPTPHASDANRGGQQVNGLYKTRKSGQTYMSLLNDLAVSGLLPTPNAAEATKYTKTLNPNSQMGMGLTALAVNGLLPTPTANEYKTTTCELYTTKTGTIRRHSPDGRSGQVGLEILAMKGMLPTPSARYWKGPTNPGTVKPGSGCKYGDTLPDTIRKMLPTPKANDFRSGMPNRVGTEHTQQLNDTIASQTGQTSQLNPLFVEEMMGFPCNWILTPFLPESRKANGGGNESIPGGAPNRLNATEMP